MDLDLLALGRRISEQRRQMGLKQDEMAEKAGITAKHLSSIENGKASPTASTLYAIGRVLGLEVSALLGDKKPAGGSCAITDEEFIKMFMAAEAGSRALIKKIGQIIIDTADI